MGVRGRSKRSGVTAPAPRPHCLEQLRDADVTGRWVFFESSIEPIGDVALDHIDRVVGGGESDPDNVRRACEL